MDQQNQEAYNTLVKARDMLVDEANAELRRRGLTPRHKSLMLGCGALCEVLENIDRNNGTYTTVTTEYRDVSRKLSRIRRLINRAKKENHGTQEQA